MGLRKKKLSGVRNPDAWDFEKMWNLEKIWDLEKVLHKNLSGVRNPDGWDFEKIWNLEKKKLFRVRNHGIGSGT